MGVASTGRSAWPGALYYTRVMRVYTRMVARERQKKRLVKKSPGETVQGRIYGDEYRKYSLNKP